MPPSAPLAQTVDRPEPTSGLTWRQELASAFSSISELLSELELDFADTELAPDILHKFPLRVPRGFVARMQKGDLNDPLLRQVLPIGCEGRLVPGFTNDPVGDLASARGRGFLQKYHGRALLMITGACAIHCRYCFRRAYPYDEGTVSASQFDTVVAMLNADTSINEVILSGGDPLSLTDQKLEIMLTALDQIDHIRRIRIHTRLPIVLPERIDSGLIRTLSQVVTPLIVVLHSNHANEVDRTVARAIQKLRPHVWNILNQAVLLRGVNDSAPALIALSERLFEIGVSPYYLHQLDPVQGAAHFLVDDDTALDIVSAAANILPGFLVPKLVREVSGAPAKISVTPNPRV
jgi:EF-P beta-lysylation protein EpmB